MIQIVEPNFEFEDERGKLIQLVREGFSQVNVIYSNAEVIRGGHYHKINKEAFYVVEGKCKVCARKEGKEKEYMFSKGDMFVIPENVVHDFDYEDYTILVSMYNKGVELENGKMDMYNEE